LFPIKLLDSKLGLSPIDLSFQEEACGIVYNSLLLYFWVILMVLA